jgi:hypothetical protein
MTLDRTVLQTGILALGLALAGWFVGHGFARGRHARTDLPNRVG